MQSLMIHGRQPALGRAELESLYGSHKIRPIGHKATVVDVDPCLLAFDRLGGSLKFCKILTELDTTDWKEIEKFLVQVSPGHSQKMPEGKMRLGLSVIGLNVGLKQLEASGLTIKKAIKKTGRNVRLVPNKEFELNTAQVLHNQLAGETGWELVFIKNGKKTIIAQTVKVQDIESYTRRDRERPKRDARVGMLPPKLAQIIINLAVGELPEEAKQSVCEIPPDMPIPVAHYSGVYLLDPFCGTGVILQEASLMGYDVQGTDIDPRMVDYSRENLRWLLSQPENRVSIPQENTTGEYAHLETADATAHLWVPPPTVIACETYLGRPLSSMPDAQTLQKIINDCNTIHKKFLRNITHQTKSGFRMCIAVPAWKTKSGFKHLEILDKLGELGYNRLKFEHAKQSDLIYHRPGQIVARELVLLKRT